MAKKRCLGKRPTKVDPRTLKFSRYLKKRALPPPPPTLDYGGKVAAWGMMQNDRLGDCTCAAAGHQIQVWTSQAKGRAVTVSDGSVIKAYSAVSGYDPRTGKNDNGAFALDVLNYWRKTGVGGRKILAYAAVDPKDHFQVKAALYLFGGLYTGLALPATAEAQVGTLWDVAGPPQGDAAPGSWGGHMVNAPRYDPDKVEVVTWGGLQWASWAFWDGYVDECYVAVTSDWLDARGKTPAGFNILALLADLSQVIGQKVA